MGNSVFCRKMKSEQYTNGESRWYIKKHIFEMVCVKRKEFWHG